MTCISRAIIEHYQNICPEKVESVEEGHTTRLDIPGARIQSVQAYVLEMVVTCRVMQTTTLHIVCFPRVI